MKNVLCYGDSLTWGFDAETGGRHAFENRWPNALSNAIGERVHVVAEGLNGRTTAFDDYTANCDRNGARFLPTLLETHQPLDLVIILLGTNDLKGITAKTASGSVSGMKRLVSLIRHHEWRFNGQTPEILIVAPPKFCETANIDVASMFPEGLEQSKMLPTLLADLADQTGCGFFDANNVCQTTPIDGIHMDAQNTANLGRNLASTVKLMLGL